MLSIRPASESDVSLLKNLILELAEYEHERHLVTISEADLVRDGFGPQPKFRALIAEWNGQTAGYALFYGSYSTWEGRPGIFLEDLFVRPEYRAKGIGKALRIYVAHLAEEEQCYGVRWEVLHWNKRAIEFYQQIGAKFLEEWKSMVLTVEALNRAAR